MQGNGTLKPNHLLLSCWLLLALPTYYFCFSFRYNIQHKSLSALQTWTKNSKLFKNRLHKPVDLFERTSSIKHVYFRSEALWMKRKIGWCCFLYSLFLTGKTGRQIHLRYFSFYLIKAIFDLLEWPGIDNVRIKHSEW